MNGLVTWHRFLDGDVRQRKLALARARQLVARMEQLQQLLLSERERRDQAERERRARGELPNFAQERTNALLERAIEKAAERVAAAKRDEEAAHAELVGAKQRVAAVDRLLQRRRERAALEERRAEQKELDERASASSLRLATTNAN